MATALMWGESTSWQIYRQLPQGRGTQGRAVSTGLHHAIMSHN